MIRPFFQRCRQDASPPLWLVANDLFLRALFARDKCPVPATDKIFVPLTSNRSLATDHRFQKIHSGTLSDPQKHAHVVLLFREIGLESALLHVGLLRLAS